MNALTRTAAMVSSLLGRDSTVIRRARPIYERLLDAASGGRGIATTFNGFPLRIDPGVRRFVPADGEPDVAACLREIVRPGDDILDIGSFVGIYAILLARWAAPAGRVLAFEPTPEMMPFLQRNVALNDAADQIVVVASALGETEGEDVFQLHAEPFRNAIGFVDPDGEALQTVRVPVTTVDAACERHGFSPSLIRMDVQGNEYGVLAGARKTIERRRADLRIVLEVHPQLWPSRGVSEANFRALLDGLHLQATPIGSEELFVPDGHILLQSNVR